MWSQQQDRDTQILEARENLKPNARFRAEGCGGSRSRTQTESAASLDVAPGRSNFAPKNASLPEEQIESIGENESSLDELCPKIVCFAK